MIQSRINSKIKYEDSEKINVKDYGQSLDIYEYEVFPDTPPIMVAVGVKQTHANDDNIVYHYIYATLDPEKNGKFQRTLGIVEIKKDDYLNILDEDDDLDLDKTTPLLFIDKTKILEIYQKQQGFSQQTKAPKVNVELEKEALEKETDIDAEEDKYLLEPITKKDGRNKNTLLEGKLNISKRSQHIESKEEAQKLIEEYKENPGKHDWIQERMKNTHYSILSVPGDGDCFFHVVCEAFKSVGIQTTIRGLREFLSNHSSVEKTFKQEQQIFSEFSLLRVGLTNNNTVITTRLEEIKTLLRESLSEQDKKTLNEEKRTLLERKRRNDEKIADINSDIYDIVPHMKKIKTEEEYREYIKTSQFWANEWAIETLENKLQVKFILFPKDENVIYTVGTLNKPNRYILAAFVSGNHYELIQYNQTRLFLSFDSLPYSVKCLGVKYRFRIPDFTSFRCEVVGGEYHNIEDEDVEDAREQQDGFVFSDDAKPHVFHKRQMADYFELRRKRNKGWERVLSDDFILNEPLNIDGQKWNSVSHYVLAGHFHQNSSFYKNFTAESDTLISNNIQIARKAVDNPGDYTLSNRGSYGNRKIKDKNILFVPLTNVNRDTLTDERINKRRKTAWLEKLKNPLIKHLLISTREAKLFQNDQDKEDTLLENLRDSLNHPM